MLGLGLVNLRLQPDPEGGFDRDPFQEVGLEHGDQSQELLQPEVLGGDVCAFPFPMNQSVSRDPSFIFIFIHPVRDYEEAQAINSFGAKTPSAAATEAVRARDLILITFSFSFGLAVGFLSFRYVRYLGIKYPTIMPTLI